MRKPPILAMLLALAALVAAEPAFAAPSAPCHLFSCIFFVNSTSL